jgi:hypothetical protein
MNLKLLVEDPIVLKVMTKFYDRSQRGIEKYGTMLTRTDLDFIDWVTHLQEEMLDAALYCERLKHEYKKNQKDAIINLMNSEYDEMLNMDSYSEQNVPKSGKKSTDKLKGCACYGSNEAHECQCKQG